MSGPLILAVDGGNSKTDLALAGADGSVLALARGPYSSPHHIGLDGCLRVLDDLLAEALERAGLEPGQRPVAVAHVLVAGADLPEEEAALQAAAAGRGWAERTVVQNDTFAILRAGSDAGWGVAVVCGAGVNCIGVAPDGRTARFPALGAITGDWGGGYDVGLAGLAAAARAEDGRGAATLLEDAVPEHFGLATPAAVGEGVHTGAIPGRRLIELAPVVFAAAAEGDAEAMAILDRLAEEIVAFARAAIVRLRMTAEPVEVLLGGGLMRAAGPDLRAAIDAGLATVGARIAARVVTDPPVIGAALLGLDDVGAGQAAHDRLRRELHAAVDGTVATIGSASDG